MTFYRIVCAVDFSEGSREAMCVAAGLARQSQAVLVPPAAQCADRERATVAWTELKQRLQVHA